MSMEDEFSLPMQYSLAARNLRGEDRLDEAGTYYVSAARGWLMQFRVLPERSDNENYEDLVSPKYLGWGGQDLLAGLLCYRLSEQEKRAQRTVRQGRLFVEDVLAAESYFHRAKNEPRLGLCYEILGDLELFAEGNDPTEEYDKAANHYQASTSDFGWQSEPEFEAIISVLVELARSAEYPLSDDQEERITVQSLTERIEYKKENYDAIIERVFDEGNWGSDVL